MANNIGFTFGRVLATLGVLLLVLLAGMLYRKPGGADLGSESLKALTADVADEGYPDVSPDGSRIVFTSGGADYDLVQVPLDGSPVRELLATGRSEHSAAWIPGKDEYVYVSDRSGQEELRRHSQADPRDVPVVSQQLFPGEVTQYLRDPAVSPDGRLVAYDRKPLVGRRFIWISPLDGGAPMRLTQGAGGEAVPTWSPDGQWVAFLMTEGGILQLASVRRLRTDLWMLEGFDTQ